MRLTEFFRLRMPDGTDPVNIEDFNDNFEVIDRELKKRISDDGSASDVTVGFEVAESRQPLKSGEKLSVLMGKAHRFFTDLKTVAFSGKYGDLIERPTLGGAAGYKVADNDTTNSSEFLSTARVAYEHGQEIDALSRDLKFPDGTGFYPDIKDGVHGYNTDSKRGADTFIPFNKIPEEMIVYIGGTNESGSASFSREFLDAMGYTKMEIHPSEKALATGRGINTFNGFETFSTASRVEYNITSVKTVDVSNTSPYSKGIVILQPGDGSTVTAIGYVKFSKK